MANYCDNLLTLAGDPAQLDAARAALAGVIERAHIAIHDEWSKKWTSDGGRFRTGFLTNTLGTPVDKAIDAIAAAHPDVTFALTWVEESPTRGRVAWRGGRVVVAHFECPPETLYLEDVYGPWKTAFYDTHDARGRRRWQRARLTVHAPPRAPLRLPPPRTTSPSETPTKETTMHHHPKSGSKASRMRHRPPRRHVAPETPDPASFPTRAADLMHRLAPQIDRLLVDALRQSADHVVLVIDPSSVLHVARVVTQTIPPVLGAAAAIYPRAALETVLEAGRSSFAAMLDRLRSPLAPAHVRIVLAIDNGLAVRDFDVGEDSLEYLSALCAFTADEAREMIVDGEPEKVVNLHGMLKMLFYADAARIKNTRMRDLLGRFQRVAVEAVAKEQGSPSPRPLGDLLYEVFKVGPIEAEMPSTPGARYGLDLACWLERVVEPKLQSVTT